MQNRTATDLTRNTLQVLLIGILIIGTFWIMRPFIPSLIWAAMIVAASWPLMLKVEKWLWGKRSLAVTAMTLVMLLIFIVPFSLAIAAIFENVDRITAWLKALETMAMPAMPPWVSSIPMFGQKLAASWQHLASGPEGLSARLAPHAGKLLSWFMSQAGSVGMIAVQFLLTVIIAAAFYAKGEAASRGVILLARRLAGHHGEDVAYLAAQTVRGVALGVVGTALVQSIIGGFGLAICGVPAPALLTGVLFILCVAQIPPALVLAPAVIWLYYSGDNAWGTVLLVIALIVGTVDNFLRPVLIRMGADLPIFLIFAGVIGGLITFGVVGLFVGPVVLAVTYRLLAVWVVGPEALQEEMRPDEELS